jgi:hypothetical protein
MSKAALSVFVFGLYLATGGVLLLFTPEALYSLTCLRPPGGTFWVRLSGMFFLYLAFYCLMAAWNERKEFFRWSVVTRPCTLLVLAACVFTGMEHPFILLFGVLDVLAALWTALALRRERLAERPAQAAPA